MRRSPPIILLFIIPLLVIARGSIERAEAKPVAPPGIAFSDGCPANATTLNLGDAIIVRGVTTGKSNDFNTLASQPYLCGDRTSVAPDVALALRLSTSGVLRVEVSPQGSFDPAVYVRPICAEEYICFDVGGSGARELVLGEFEAGTYNVIVDGHVTTGGRFTLTASLDAPFCGDGVVSPSAGEECDTGDLVGAGCTNCLLDPPAAGSETCPGESISIGPGVTFVNGTTLGYSNDLAGSRSFPPGGVDRVYAVTPTASGTLTVRLGLDATGADICAQDITAPGCWDRVLYARATCGDALTELDCSDAGAFSVEEIQFAVVAGSTYAVVVDGYDDQFYSSGPYALQFTLQ